MKRLLLINSVCGIGSTGRICTSIAKEYERNGYDVKIGYGRHKKTSKDSEKYAVRIGTFFDVLIHACITIFFDKHGLGSISATKKFLKWAESYNPDVLWLHNIHGFYINYELLFLWIKSRPTMEVKWTLHDCWSFTGHCAYFTFSGCNKWKKECNHCISIHNYPFSLCVDKYKKNFLRKKASFTGVNNLCLITPSEWLAKLTRNSFLNMYPVKVYNNKIDENTFKRIDVEERKIQLFSGKKVILGVANPWSKRKGLDDLLLLSRNLSDEFVVIIIGLSFIKKLYLQIKIKFNMFKNLEESRKTCAKVIQNNNKSFSIIDGHYLVKKGIEFILEAILDSERKKNGAMDIIGNGANVKLLTKVNNVADLVEYYNYADYLVNPTYEENYPTVNLEAIACGATVVSYNTGGCAETLENKEK